MYAFIVNPNARTGLGLKVWRQLEPVLRERGVPYRVYMTRYPGQAEEFARKLTSSGEEITLVVLGGDGAINEVVNGIQDHDKVTFACIPIGSGNDFARSMGLPKDPLRILEQILEPSGYTYIDIGRTTLADGTSRRFAVSSGIGFDADVCFHNTSSSGIKRMLNRLRLGKLSYTGVAVMLLLSLKPHPLTVSFDGRKRSFRKVIFAAAMNQRYEGGGFKFCPKADPGDGMLDVIVVAGIPRLFVLFLLPTAYLGWHVHFPGIHIFRCREAEICGDTPLPVHTDGEPTDRVTQAVFTLEPEKLRFIQ